MTENPSYVLASTTKNTPIYLNCHVLLNVTDQFEEDFKKTAFYNIKKVDDPDENDEEEDDDETGSRDDDEVRKYYNKQYENNVHKTNQKTNVQPPKPRTKRDVAASGLSFEWQRDGISVITIGLNTDKTVAVDGFTLFPNGTLKFQPSNATDGDYRCKVKYTKRGKSHIDIGPMISRATRVEVASECD